MIESYQEEMELQKPEPQDANFATIGQVFDDGVSLVFDGEDEASQKHYKVNAFMVFNPGDRVHIMKDSGTYVVICSIGNPKTSFNADTASEATNAINATNAANATSATNAAIAEKLKTARKISLEGHAKGETSFDGSADKSINVSGIRANSILNQYTGYGDIYFRLNVVGRFQIKQGTGSWYTITTE